MCLCRCGAPPSLTSRAQAAAESDEKVAELERKLAKEKKRSKKSNNGEKVSDEMKEQLSEALKRAQAAEAQVQKLQEASASTARALPDLAPAPSSDEIAAITEKLHAAEQSAQSKAAEVAALQASIEKLKKEAAVQAAQRVSAREEEMSEMLKRIAGDLDATKEKVRVVECAFCALWSGVLCVRVFMCVCVFSLKLALTRSSLAPRGGGARDGGGGGARREQQREDRG